MGTRSNTVVIDAHGNKKLVNMYRQFDGYPSGHGKELAAFLKDMHMCNGIALGKEKPAKLANGAGCLAAQMIAHFKRDEVGGIYLDDPKGALDNDFAYIVKADTMNPERGIEVAVKTWGGKTLFTGKPEEFAAFCETNDD